MIRKNDLGIVTRNYTNAILDIYKNEKKYKEKAKKTALFIKENLGWDVFTDKMIKAYEDALKKY